MVYVGSGSTLPQSFFPHTLYSFVSLTMSKRPKQAKRPRKQLLSMSSDEDEPEDVDVHIKYSRRGPVFTTRPSSPPPPPRTPSATPSPSKRRRELSPDDNYGGGWMDQPDLPPLDQANDFVTAGKGKSGYVSCPIPLIHISISSMTRLKMMSSTTSCSTETRSSL